MWFLGLRIFLVRVSGMIPRITGLFWSRIGSAARPSLGQEVLFGASELPLQPFVCSKRRYRASLVAQWLGVHLPMQGTRVRVLVREDPTCRGATGPVRHNYWACALESESHNYWAHMPQLLKPARPRAHAPQRERPPQWEACALQRRVDPTRLD